MKNSIIHIYLYGMLRRSSNGSKIIHISKIHPIVKWAIRLPHKYQVEIINELVECGLLKKRGRDNYEFSITDIENPPCDSLGEPLW